MKNLTHTIKKTILFEVEDYKILLRNIPATIVVFFTFSCIFMNIYANRQLIDAKYLALDCGFLLSWVSFLCMDVITKRFGAKPAIKISLLALGFNLLSCLVAFLISHIGSNWSAYYEYGSVANDALNMTFSGTWYILLGSTIAMIISSFVNSLLNEHIGKKLKHDTFINYCIRTYVSTAIGQFLDNLIFALIVSVKFFGWTPIQVLMCSITGAVAELVAEMVFGPIGFKICNSWDKDDIGRQYIDFKQSHNKGV